MPTFSNTVTALQLQVDGAPLRYADLLKTVAITPVPVANDGVVTYPPGLTVAEISDRLTLIASCNAALPTGATITLSAGDKVLALQLVDAFYWKVTSAEIVAFRAALLAAS